MGKNCKEAIFTTRPYNPASCHWKSPLCHAIIFSNFFKFIFYTFIWYLTQSFFLPIYCKQGMALCK
ncbi:MAG TPA: hypothetical protein DCZ76_03745 [Treponema sp.]|nr:hypothetical protein [Treponema sp.]